MTAPPLHVAVFSVHSSPEGRLGSPDTGGMSVYIREVARRFGALGHRVDIFTGDAPEDAVLTVAPNVRLITRLAGVRRPQDKLGWHPLLPEFFSATEDFRAREEIRYDLIHSHYWLSGLLGLTCQARWGVPHMTMFHTLAAVKNRLEGREAEPPLRVRGERRVARNCHRIVAPTPRERDEICQATGVPSAKVAVIPCGVDLERFRPVDGAAARAPLGIPPTAPVLLFVGRFAPLKGLDRLVAALPLLTLDPPTLLLLAGDDGGTCSPALRQQAADLGISDRVRFLGPVPHDELPALYSAADAVVLPSFYESFGLVSLEAMACGTPVVGTPVGVLEHLLQPGRNGERVPEPTPEAIAAGIRRALRRHASGGWDPEAVRATVRDYSWDRVASAVLNEYRTLPTPPNPAMTSWRSHGPS